MPSQRKTKSEDRIDWLAARLARMRVPLGFFCAGAVLYLAQPTLRSLSIGGGIALVGELIRFWAAGHLEKGREVTQSGPYRITRHPLYLGSAIIATGAAVALARPAAAAVIAIYMVVTIVSAIRHEESSMRASFGDRYDAYAQSRGEPVSRRFSFARAIRNKEHRAVTGLAAAVAILWAKAFFLS